MANTFVLKSIQMVGAFVLVELNCLMNIIVVLLRFTLGQLATCVIAIAHVSACCHKQIYANVFFEIHANALTSSTF